MDFSLRPANLPADYTRIAALLNTAFTKPTTAAELATEDAELPPGSIKAQLIALDPQGAAIGYAEAHSYPNTKAGKFYVHVAVDPAGRGLGAGTALLTEIERTVRAHGANYLLGNVRDNDPASLRFAEQRGYAVQGHDFYSTLDLAAWDPAPFAGVLERVQAGGIRLFETNDDRKLYDLMAQTMPDLPHYEAQSFMSFETWRGAFRKPESQIIAAADGDRFVGVTMIERADPDTYYTPHTSVLREYRGRHIALALKVAAIEAARAKGARFMTTGNDALNAPMLAVNQRLGYVPTAGGYDVAKHC
jgi:GNAT superfamily N-acetyltransferase